MVKAMNPPYIDFSTITTHLALTGFWGVVAENVTRFPVKVGLVVNVTFEAPLLVGVEGILSYRIPVIDDVTEDLSIYFDEITEQIHKFKVEKGLATVVHCLVGVSRSASIVMGKLASK